MHVGKLMARLNPKNVRFDVGSGGIPELTSTDIAAALAFVDRGLGRELLCKVWWPDGAALTERQLFDFLETIQRDEWSRRESAMLDGLLAVATRGSRGQGSYAAAHENRWPRMVLVEHGLPVLADAYGRVRKAVVAEVCSTGLCPKCAGRGLVCNSMGVHSACSTCEGSGHHRISERERGEACGMAWKTYRETWVRVYDWTFQQCMDAVHQATRQFEAAVGG
ncbi:hypothetical protein ISN76_13030 [Dyella halodurans]|uniref:Antitermination protein n=1 Tax=Dyella halodurans TaxID=1920171 RepID=A0ABV9C104_9GAMM|nr:hypothetical protein [Dyella halodurans]